MSLLDEITQNVSQMSEEELRAEFLKAQEDKIKRQAKQKEYNSSPEAKAKRVEYQKSRNEKIKQDPDAYEKVKATRKAYMAKPEVKEKMKAYRDERNLKMKLILARAKELGITVDTKSA